MYKNYQAHTSEPKTYASLNFITKQAETEKNIDKNSYKKQKLISTLKLNSPEIPGHPERFLQIKRD